MSQCGRHSFLPSPGWGPQLSALMRPCLLVLALGTLSGYCFLSCLSSHQGVDAIKSDVMFALLSMIFYHLGKPRTQQGLEVHIE